MPKQKAVGAGCLLKEIPTAFSLSKSLAIKVLHLASASDAAIVVAWYSNVHRRGRQTQKQLHCHWMPAKWLLKLRRLRTVASNSPPRPSNPALSAHRSFAVLLIAVICSACLGLSFIS